MSDTAAGRNTKPGPRPPAPARPQPPRAAPASVSASRASCATARSGPAPASRGPRPPLAASLPRAIPLDGSETYWSIHPDFMHACRRDARPTLETTGNNGRRQEPRSDRRRLSLDGRRAHRCWAAGTLAGTRLPNTRPLRISRRLHQGSGASERETPRIPVRSGSRAGSNSVGRPRTRPVRRGMR